MKYQFKCSNRSLDIDNEDEFCKLKGDELSELLYYDDKFIRWMDYRDIMKFSTGDITLTLLKHPHLIHYFSVKLPKLNYSQWAKLIEKENNILIWLSYINYDYYMMHLVQLQLKEKS